LERHHIAGRTFGDENVPVCRNCHRKLSDLQKDHPPHIGAPPDPLECSRIFSSASLICSNY
jgi:hypothetical protein